jgi:hypothetical protein
MRLFKLFGFVVILLFSLRLTNAGSTESRDVLPTPVMRTVNPDTVKAGDVATVSGEYLDKSRVEEVYLTNGTVDAKVEIVEQTATAIKFKVPEKLAPGRYNLMVLLVSDPPKLIEEPARVTVAQ